MNESIVPRDVLERRLQATEDALAYALHAMKAAKHLIQRAVPVGMQDKTLLRIRTMIETMADTPVMAGPALANFVYRQTMTEAAGLAGQVARKGDAEWKAACAAVVEELRKRGV